MFEEYKDLYKLTSKTVDDHIEFYKTNESLSRGDLFNLWRKLSGQAENFDKKDWSESWNPNNKNFHAFESHKFQAKYLIQGFLTHVLEELIRRLINDYTKCVELTKSLKPAQINDNNLSELIRSEVKRQVKEEFANQKRKTKKTIVPIYLPRIPLITTAGIPIIAASVKRDFAKSKKIKK